MRFASAAGTLPSIPTRRPAITPLETARRAYGAATIGYGTYALARPSHLARQLGIDEHTATRLGRAFGVRDVSHGLWLLSARTRRSRTRALQARVIIDVADALLCGMLAPHPAGRARGAGAATGWATLASALLIADRRAGRSR